MTDFGVNQGLVEEMFLLWAANPASVDDAWRRYFDGLDPSDWPQLTSAGSIAAPPEAVPPPSNGNGGGMIPAGASAPRMPSGLFKLPPTSETVPFVDRRGGERRTSFAPSGEVMAATQLQARLSALVNAYRVRGHLFANLDPLARSPKEAKELFLSRYGLDHVEPDTVFSSGDLAGPPQATLAEILERLNDTYTRSIGVEYTFLEDSEARSWLQDQMESTCNRLELSREEQVPHPHEAHGRRDLRAIPPHQVHRREALLGRGRRKRHPDARSPGRARRTAGGRRDRSRYGSPRSTERDGQLHGDERPRHLRGVRRRRSRAEPRRWRREVPPRVLARSSHRRGKKTCTSRSRSTRATSSS